ncbi:MAG: response regulator [Pyrinomonadaceae bacterium]
MGNFLIIDSNTSFAAKLYAAMAGDAAGASENVIDVSSVANLGEVGRTIRDRVAAKPDAVIMINVEAKLENGFHQDQRVVELAFWLRCGFKLLNPIVFYGAQSVNKLLKDRPENLILLSPGCYHVRLPLSREQIEKIKSSAPAPALDTLKPYLRPKINLGGARHRYANFAGMNFMSNVAADVHNAGTQGVGEILDKRASEFHEFYDFRRSLTYHILATYFDLEKLSRIDDARKGTLKIAAPLAREKRVLLIDDLADKGWAKILKKVIYGEVEKSRLASIKTHVNEGGQRRFDMEKLAANLSYAIKTHKPHLVLLDLRLDGEEASDTLGGLGGFWLLKRIKSHPDFKGVPVIMFTATTNAESVKALLSAGAEAVWTKPGLDEGLSAEGIIRRYAQLIALINHAFSPDYGLLSRFDDNTDSAFDINALDFEAVRNLLLRKLDLIKYRLKLYSGAELSALTPEPYRSVDAIYLDANVLLRERNYERIVSAVYKLAGLTANSQFRYRHRSQVRTAALPRVVLMNSVYDEIIKLAKKDDYQRKERNGRFEKHVLLHLRAMMSLLLLKQMFSDKLVRAELSKDSGKPLSELLSPKEKVYADGYILDEVADLLITRSGKSISYCGDTRIIFVTGDKKLAAKLKQFRNEASDNLIIKKPEELEADMDGVAI